MQTHSILDSSKTCYILIAPPPWYSTCVASIGAALATIYATRRLFQTLPCRLSVLRYCLIWTMQRSPTILPICTASTCLSPIWPMRIEDRGLKRHIWRETRCCLAHICMPVEWNRDSTARGETSLANSSSPFDQPSRGFRCVFYTVPVPNDLHRDQLQKENVFKPFHSAKSTPGPLS